MASPPAANAVVPAQLGFLAIFNPSLGYTDETVEDQIVYYASVATQSSPHRRRRARGRPTDDISKEERNERLRQIGLAQGMASFGRGFADGSSVDTIDTEKSRLVFHELEPGWWILAVRHGAPPFHVSHPLLTIAEHRPHQDPSASATSQQKQRRGTRREV
jgi:hypothetical protein